MTSKTARAVIYCRISRDRTGAGLGVDRQEAECRELARRLGVEVVRVYMDNDISAYSGKRRKGYEQLLADIEAGVATVVLAWHLDRLHRSPVELEKYIDVSDRHSALTYTVTAGVIDLSTPSGQMTARIAGAVAKHESQHKSTRIKAKTAELAAQGKPNGGPRPFGFEKDGKTLRPKEAAAIKAATDDLLAGVSLTAIAAGLNKQGVRTARGMEWSRTTARKMLLRERNAGLLVHRGAEIGPAPWDPVISEEKYRAVVAVLGNPDRRTVVDANRQYLGSGLYRCGVCDGPMVAGRTGRTPTPAYRCEQAPKDGKRHVARVASPVDEMVAETIIARLARKDAAALFAKRGPDMAGLHAEANALRTRLTGLSEAFGEGAVTLEQLRAGTAKIRARLGEIDGQLAAATGLAPVAALVAAENIRERWSEFDLERQRAVVDCLVTVRILPAPRGRRPGGEYFDPDFVEITWR